MKLEFSKPVTRVEFWKSDPAAFRSGPDQSVSISDHDVVSCFEALLDRDFKEFKYELDPEAPKYFVLLHNGKSAPTAVSVIGNVLLTDARSLLSDSSELWEILEDFFGQLQPKKIKFRGKPCVLD